MEAKAGTAESPVFCESKKWPITAKVYGTKDNQNAEHFFHVNISLDIAKQCNDDECNFFTSIN